MLLILNCDEHFSSNMCWCLLSCMCVLVLLCTCSKQHFSSALRGVPKQLPIVFFRSCALLRSLFRLALCTCLGGLLLSVSSLSAVSLCRQGLLTAKSHFPGGFIFWHRHSFDLCGKPFLPQLLLAASTSTTHVCCAAVNARGDVRQFKSL